MIIIKLKFKNIFKSIRSKVNNDDSLTFDELLFNLSNQEISKELFINIPTVSACVNLISGIIASLPVELYKNRNGNVELLEDPRLILLNDTTGDTLDGFQFKQALINDFLLYGEGYCYINRRRNNIYSLHYVENVKVSIVNNTDPIFKHSKINVIGQSYELYDFIKILRRSKNGSEGIGILDENYESLKVIFNALRYEGLLVESGGNKKGFLKSQSRLSKEAITELKSQWNNMYSNNKSNCIVLNNGLEFQESSNTSVEMQLNENKKTNAIEICKMFNVPEKILNGNCNDDDFQTFIRLTILPIISQFETALNNSLLTNNERSTHYFKFNTKELLKGDLIKRMTAYSIAVKSGIMQLDEVRFNEDLSPLGLNFIKLGLQDVLYDPINKQIYTPNTDKTADVQAMEGGEVLNEDRDKVEQSSN